MKKLKFPKPGEINNYLVNLPLVRRFIRWTKRYSLPGFFNVPLYDVGAFLVHETRRNDLFTRANSMAFSFFLSIFPSLMSLFTLLPYLRKYLLNWFLPNEGANFEQVLQEEIQAILPGNVGLTISNFIEDLVTNPRVGLLSAGFLMAIFFSTNGMMSMMRGFEKSYPKTFKKRTGVKKRLVAIFLTFLLAVIVIFSVVFVILGNSIIRWITNSVNLSHFAGLGISFIRWVVILFVYYSVISIIYRFGAAVIRKFRWLSPGATLASVLSLISSLIFSYYVDRFGHHNKLYGSFGTVIATMLWIQINSLIILIGFELNAGIAISRDLKQTMEPDDK